MFDGIVFASVSDFLQMGSYAFHVWSVYVLFTIFIVANLVVPRLQRKQFIREQKSSAQRDVQMNRAASSGSDAPGDTGPGDSI